MFPPQRPAAAAAAACPLSHTTRVHCIEVEVQTGVQMLPIEICQKKRGKNESKNIDRGQPDTGYY